MYTTTCFTSNKTPISYSSHFCNMSQSHSLYLPFPSFVIDLPSVRTLASQGYLMEQFIPLLWNILNTQ